jgi:hypothetical protein
VEKIKKRASIGEASGEKRKIGEYKSDKNNKKI